MTYPATQLDPTLADLDRRVSALEGNDVPDPPDPVPTPEGVDLVVLDVVVPPGLTTGQPATLGVTVKNAGTVATPTGAIVGVGFLLDDAQAGAQVTWVSTTAGLGPGAQVVLDTATAENTGGPWVPTVDGAHTLTAFVDDLNRIPEAAEDNNKRTVDVTIAKGAVAPAGTLFVPGSSWNTRKIPAGYIDACTPTLQAVSWQINASSYGHPIAWATDADPVATFHMPNTWGWPACTLQLHMPDSAVPASGSDGHLCLMHKTSGDLVDMWQLHGSNRDWTCSAWARHNWKTGQGWGTPSPFQSAGVTVSGAPTAAGTITHDELTAAVIPHALCCAFSYEQLRAPQVPPAIANDTGGGGGGSAGQPLQQGMLLVATGNEPGGLNLAEHALFVALSTLGAFIVDKADPGGVAYVYCAEARDGGAFRPDKLTAIGRQLRAVRTSA